jgi:hypothetical protein
MALHPHGQMMAGGWFGQSYAGAVVRGWGAIARDRERVERLIRHLCDTDARLDTWPSLPN